MVENEKNKGFEFDKDFTVNGLKKIAKKINAKEGKNRQGWIDSIKEKIEEKVIVVKLVEKKLETEEKKEVELGSDKEERNLDDIKKLEKELKLREKKEGKDEEGYKILVRKLLILYDEVSKARIDLNSKLRAHLRKVREGSSSNEIDKLKKETDKAQKNLEEIVKELNGVKTKARENEKYKKRFEYLTVYNHPI